MVGTDELLTNLSSFTVYPNPAYAAFTVSGLREGQGKLSVWDVSGRLLLNKAFIGPEVKVELPANTQSGIYLIKILMEDGSAYFQKLIVP